MMRRMSVSLVCLFAVVNLFAQQIVKVWDKRFGGDAADVARAIQMTVDDGCIVAGHSYSGVDGDKTENSWGQSDYWLVKLDRTGNKIWDKRFGGDSYDEAYAIQSTTNDGYVVAGTSLSGLSGDKTEASRGESDYWVVKLDGAGNKVWDKRFGGDLYDYAYAIQATTDGGYIVAGASLSGISGDKTEASRGGSDYWLVKLDGAGNKIWDKRFGGDLHDYAYAVQPTTDGEYIVAGTSYSGVSGDKTEASRGGSDYWVVKLDGAGNKVWDKRFGGDSHDDARAVQLTADGGYIVAGASSSGISGDKTEASRGEYDYWVVKLDGAGNKVWDKCFGGSELDFAVDIYPTEDGGYIVVGCSFSGADGDKSESSRGGSDYWLVKLDGSGNKVWDKRFGGTSDDYGYAVRQASNGSYVVVGYSYSVADGDKSEGSRGNNDYWLVKFGFAGAVSFAPTNYNVSESVGSCELTIVRTNGSSGTGSVQFVTVDGTAVAGTDYVWTNGVLQWADGETNKTISLALINRHGVAGTRAFNVVLSGASVVTLGEAATATVSIVVNPPAAPANVIASKAVYTNEVGVTWDAVADVVSYEVWRSATEGDTAIAEKISGAGLSGTNYADTNALENLTYYYWVKAVNGAGAGDFSASDYGYRGVIGPLVYVNNKVGLVPVGPREALTLAVEMMNVGPYLGVPVDWWMVGYVRGGNAWYYLNSAMQWTAFSGNLAECRPVYQGGLVHTGVVPLFENFTLPSGIYDLWFAVDYPMDGVLNLNNPILFNHAVISVE